MITECPNSYCEWEYVSDAMECWEYYESGFLPEVHDTNLNRPASILDQTLFFKDAHNIVAGVKAKAEKKALDEVKGSKK